MCLKPILIRNTNLGSPNKYRDTTSAFIPVPCGRCSVCLALKQQYIVQRVQMESLSHDLYFGTLTYNNDSLPILRIGEFVLAYPDISDWQKMIKRIRKYDELPEFRYLVVSEYGGKRHRPHFHFILSFPKNPAHTLADRRSFEFKLFNLFLKEWRRNYAYIPNKFYKDGSPRVNTRRPDWRPICTYYRSRKSYNFDLHYLDPRSSTAGLDDVAFYVSKYCLKYDKWIDKLKSKLFFNLSETDFQYAWDYMRPRRLMSKGFGSPDDRLVISHINKGIDLAINDGSALYPYFISPVNGNTFPLAPYYSTKFLRLCDLLVFNSRKSNILTEDDMMLSTDSDLTFEEVQRKEDRFNAVRDWLEDRHTYEDDEMNNINNILISNIYGQIQTAPFLDSDFADSWEDY